MTDPITIVRSDETSHGAYRAAIPGSPRPAELTWRAQGNVRVADHTFVPPEARGTGIAARLVEQMIADARAQGFTIVPECSYVAVAFRRHPEWADLLAGTDG